jgi:hypothetical protein
MTPRIMSIPANMVSVLQGAVILASFGEDGINDPYARKSSLVGFCTPR